MFEHVENDCKHRSFLVLGNKCLNMLNMSVNSEVFPYRLTSDNMLHLNLALNMNILYLLTSV